MPNALDPQYWGNYNAPQYASGCVLGGERRSAPGRSPPGGARGATLLMKWTGFSWACARTRGVAPSPSGFTVSSCKDYPAKLASLDLDIAIAPLENNPFNACKSNLRLLEYGAMGWPVVCSDVYPYRRTMNPPVLAVPNDDQAWITALRNLINDPGLRQAQAKRARLAAATYLLENHVNYLVPAIFSSHDVE